MDTKVQEVGRKVLGFRCKVQRSDTKYESCGSNPKGVCKQPKARHEGFWEGQGLTGAAQNWLGIDKRVQDNVLKRAHSPEGVQMPKTDVVRVRAHLRLAVPTFIRPDHPHHLVRPAGPTRPYRPLSHSLSQTLICFYYPSLLGTLNSP